MIETTNPEIDVNQLMERVRAEAAKIPARPRRVRPGANGAMPALPAIPSLPQAPSVWIPGGVTPRKEKLDELLLNTRQKTEVSSSIPKFLRGLFRKQGSYNKGVLDSIKVLAQSNQELAKRVHEIGTCLGQLNGWILALHQHRDADVQWMTAAASSFAMMARHREELRDLETDLQTQLEEQQATASQRVGEIEARIQRLGEIEARVQRVGEIEAQVQRLGEIETQAAAAAAQRLSEIETRVERLGEIETRVERLGEIETRMGAVESNDRALLDHINNVHAEANTVAEQAHGLQQQMDRAGVHLRSLQTQIDGVGTHLNNLQGEFARRTEQAQIDKAAEHLRNLQVQADRLGVHINNLQGFVDRHTAETNAIQHNLERRIDDHAGLGEKLVHLEERQTSEGVFIKGELSEQSSLLQRLLGPGEETGAKPKPLVLNASDRKKARALDSFYLSFENRFRGSRSEIKKRVKFYLPFLEKAKAGNPGRPVLDLGCGRGEWLELLKENKLEGQGVDLNAAMIAQCKERDLEAIHGDALDYLRSLRPNSQGGVTGFHIIEHLPFETLMEFLRETRRVLKAGGIAIFESPNCNNLVIGAAQFNIDPTHRNPVFPETAEFMLQSHGFERTTIKYLSPVPNVDFDTSTRELAIVKDMLYGPQDFAVIAYKPAAR
jgi:O-antigen chain-terminating methyltransferase